MKVDVVMVELALTLAMASLGVFLSSLVVLLISRLRHAVDAQIQETRELTVVADNLYRGLENARDRQQTLIDMVRRLEAVQTDHSEIGRLHRYSISMLEALAAAAGLAHDPDAHEDAEGRIARLERR